MRHTKAKCEVCGRQATKKVGGLASCGRQHRVRPPASRTSPNVTRQFTVALEWGPVHRGASMATVPSTGAVYEYLSAFLKGKFKVLGVSEGSTTRTIMQLSEEE